jgi:hypothetical protein
MSKVLVTRAQGFSGSNRVVVTRAQGFGASGARVLVTRAQGYAETVDVSINIGANATWEPFDDVVMSAVRAGGTPEPTFCTWTQTAGPTVPLTIDTAAATCTFTAPATENGATLTFRCATAAGAVATVTHTAKAHAGFWAAINGVLRGYGITVAT